MTQIDLITGFLGAGKTTFIQQYLAFLRQQGQTFAVIENEYGAPGIDSAILEGEGAFVREISGGCICCTLKVGFYNLLDQLAGTYDRIVVEPSGIFNCDDFIEILSTPSLQGRIQLGMAVGIVDPKQVLQMSAIEREVLASELLPMGAILFSKVQQNPSSVIQRAREQVIQILCHAAPKLTRKQASTLLHIFSWDQITDSYFLQLQQASLKYRNHERIVSDHSTLFHSMTLRLNTAFTYDELESILETIQDGKHGNILRIKGQISSESGGIYVINSVSGQTQIEEDANISIQSPRLNIIGRGIRRKPIAALFKK